MPVNRCRSCRQPKWSTDPCNNPDCSSLQATIAIKCRRQPITSRRAASSYDLFNQVDRLPTAARSTLGGQSYVADFDGQHYIG